MELFIAGGVGEHGRNCFCVRGGRVRFLVDCGLMVGTPDDPYPRLAPEEIRHLDAVFLTHSHADHAGALPWLYENGFRGTVAASGETLAQLPFEPPIRAALEVCCLGGSGGFGSVRVQWGRSSHCAGSVWYHFSEGERSVLFSGDYTEDALVYACDPQLRSEAARETAERVLSSGGAAVMTGTLEAGSYSERLFRQGRMALLRYPVHLNRAQYRLLTQENDFARALPYHSPAFSAPRTLSF